MDGWIAGCVSEERMREKNKVKERMKDDERKKNERKQERSAMQKMQIEREFSLSLSSASLTFGLSRLIATSFHFFCCQLFPSFFIHIGFFNHIFWTSFGHLLDISWTSFGHLLDISCKLELKSGQSGHFYPEADCIKRKQSNMESNKLPTRNPPKRSLVLVTFFSVTFFLVTVIDVTSGCSCMVLPSPKDYFCSSSFVAVVRVEEEAVPCGLFSKCYPIHLIQSLKVDKHKVNKEEFINMTYLKTPEDEGMCGVALIPKEEYIITAALTNSGEITVYSCGLVVNWTRMEEERKGVFLQDFEPRLYCTEREGINPIKRRK